MTPYRQQRSSGFCFDTARGQKYIMCHIYQHDYINWQKNSEMDKWGMLCDNIDDDLMMEMSVTKNIFVLFFDSYI